MRDGLLTDHRCIDLLKIDAEGHDYSVLAGASRLLANGRIDIIQFEFNEMNVISRVFFKDFWHLLQSFTLYRLLPTGLLPIREYDPVECEVFAFQNVIALRRGVT